MDISTPKNHAEFRIALAALIERPGMTPAELGQQVDALIHYCQRRNVSLTHCLVGYEGQRLAAASLCVDGAGRMSSLFIPSHTRYLAPPTTAARLLNEHTSLARERNVQLLQGTVAPEATAEAAVYQVAGFELLTQLIYMDSDVTSIKTPSNTGCDVEWTVYSPDTHSLFASVIQGTYEDSLDCVALNGVRGIEDILASHRSAGQFDPQLWFVACIGGKPAGVILLSRLPERWALEVVYMGVLPDWRGRGCGITLLKRAVETAFRQALTTLTLTVDVGNAPALKLYKLFGLREMMRRDIWLRKL